MAWLKFLIGLEQPPASLSIIISALVTRWDMANPSLANRSAILPCLARPASEVSPKRGSRRGRIRAVTDCSRRTMDSS